MSLAAGTRLGPYEIVAVLGAGGMGEVYRARDTRLNRTVAIKVLPSHFSEDADRRQRFEREARAVSSLNHPHICALYDVGRQEGLDFLVMEHLEGQTLTERLEKGGLPTVQVLRYGTEIADALDKAHRQGIVHRDLKPGNIMLTKAGAKLLDFGLAKMNWLDAPPAADVSKLDTREKPLTGDGAVLGTVQYMAPEQLEGKTGDARTDIFALGSVLYEMATGQRAFQAKSQASLIVAILEHDPPPMTTLQPLAPPALERLVKTCLAKDPEDRWQSAHDVASELQWIRDAGGLTGRDESGERNRRLRERLAWLTALALGGALAVAVASRRPAATDLRPLRFTVSPEAGTSLSKGTLALSPDGRSLVFDAADANGRTRLWLRPLDAPTSTPLAGTEGGGEPFWSPDGRFIGFFADGKLKKIAAGGGPAQTIAPDTPDPRGGTWNADDVIVYGPEARGPLFRVSAAGGAPAPATALDPSRRDLTHRYPHFLPDGRHFLFTVVTPREDTSGIFLGALDSKQVQRLSGDVSVTAYAPPGFLFFVRDAALMVQRFDARGLTSIGESEVLAQPAWNDSPLKWGWTGLSARGDAVAYRDGLPERRRLTWLDREGRVTGTVGDEDAYADMALSPDGSRLALSIGGTNGPSALWVRDLERNTVSRLSADSSDHIYLVWSPGGERIAFGSTRTGTDGLFVQAANGSDSPDLLLEKKQAYANDWSPDGRLLLFFHSPGPGTKLDLWTVPVSEERKIEPFLATSFSEYQGRFSPDGRFVAYVSDETGRLEVYVRAFPAGAERWQISAAGGWFPEWRRDGRELYYLSSRSEMMAAEVRPAGSRLVFGSPRRLFETTLPRLSQSLSSVNNHLYMVTADGQRFLVMAPVTDPAQDRIAVIVNWAAALKH
jgi:Tol biopolymer transport system component/predicted Ser/Thr protein kinase